MSKSALNMFEDVFAQMRELPADLRQDLPVLLVNRKGDHCSAFMRTENIIGYAGNCSKSVGKTFVHVPIDSLFNELA